MQTKITILSGKGGTGKTTLSLGLAHYYAELIDQSVSLIDLDPQKSSSTYALLCEKVHVKKLSFSINNAQSDLLIIDSAPDAISTTSADDYAVIITQPSRLDIVASLDVYKNCDPDKTVFAVNRDPQNSTSSMMIDMLREATQKEPVIMPELPSMSYIYAHCFIPGQVIDDSKHIASTRIVSKKFADFAEKIALNLFTI